jgi:hypothetical protein
MHSEQRDKHNIEVEDGEEDQQTEHRPEWDRNFEDENSLSPAPDHLLFGSSVAQENSQLHPVVTIVVDLGTFRWS